jgi:predicted PolB exonuclease-like 3'-5' exonuclease
MKTNPVVYDIETAPLSKDVLASRKPTFSPPGNLKDPEKIRVALEDKEHEWYAKAALSAQTGRVLVVGLWQAGTVDFLQGDEESMLADFWQQYKRTSPCTWIGWNSRRFDLPFLLRRSWILGVDVDPFVMTGRYFNRRFQDAMEWWDCFQHDSEAGSSSLNAVSKSLGLAGKTGSGAEFAMLYAADKKAALDYLKNDLVMTASVAEIIGTARFEIDEA